MTALNHKNRRLSKTVKTIRGGRKLRSATLRIEIKKNTVIGMDRVVTQLSQEHAGRKWVFFGRSSTKKQMRNIELQYEACKKECEKYGCELIGEYWAVEKGQITSRRKLIEAINFAKENNAFVIASSSDRFFRKFKESDENNYTPPSQEDIQRFQDFRMDNENKNDPDECVELVSLLDPNENFLNTQSYYKKLGRQRELRNKGKRAKGRATLEEQKQFIPEIYYLLTIGFSPNSIAKKLKRSDTTVRNYKKCFILQGVNFIKPDSYIDKYNGLSINELKLHRQHKHAYVNSGINYKQLKKDLIGIKKKKLNEDDIVLLRNTCS